MKLANFVTGGQHRAGVVLDGTILDVASVSSAYAGVSSVDQLLSGSMLDELAARTASLHGNAKLEGVQLCPPVERPDKILMTAVNYRSHADEGKSAPPSSPYFFTKFDSCLVGHGLPILSPKVSQAMDYEAELAVVIGKRGKYIAKDEAMGFVAGFTAANDVSYRDLQFPDGWPTILNRQGQNWVKGKALDRSLPLGPWLVTKDEVGDPQDLGISLAVNGERRQSQRTSDMIFGVAELVSYASEGQTLLPGDLICTGTPAGVAKDTGGRYLKPGDVVSVTVERIGTLTNMVEAEGH